MKISFTLSRFAVVVSILLICGCSREHLEAKITIYQAEQAHYKAHSLKTQKVSVEKRKELYRKACNGFIKGYRLKKDLFNYYQASYAYEACMWADERDSANLFGDLLETLKEPTHGPDAAMLME